SDLPPLRIHHFLVCMAVLAAMLSLEQRDRSGAYATMPFGFVVQMAVMYAIIAAGVTLAGFSLWWHAKGHAALAQPGQWLLLSYLIALPRLLLPALLPFYAMDFIGRPWTIIILIRDPTDVALAIIRLILVFAYYGLPVLFFAWCAWRIADTRPWRILFTICAMGEVVFILPILGIPLWQWVPSNTAAALKISGSNVTLLLTAWAAAQDVLRKKQRSWSHWAGVGLFMAWRLSNLVGGVLLLFWLGWY
ncbi:MAG: hypothetical protein L0Z07_00915, partial [Planctomycetes bacterium]|nr:hypothetical protein [Planctomycetota bacterium]